MFLQLNARPKITHSNLQDQEVVENAGGPGHSVYLQKLERCNVVITSKVNRVVIEHCVDTSISFANVIAGVEVVHSRNLTLKNVVQPPAPTVQIDMSSQCNLVWPPLSLHLTKFVFAAVSGTTFSEFENAEDPQSPSRICFSPEDVGHDQQQVWITSDPDRRLNQSNTADMKQHCYIQLN
eukprot:TRINITY_DN5575_c0_g1_i1.p1 TRINITY_DN5575_c0_g1~~TRINITY_DN5575_c0_g1_i1.p1  ORF type:complete len:198 (+),score=93.91 TRINITY_DN5575_c0_g1_i1:57-596(+)